MRLHAIESSHYRYVPMTHSQLHLVEAAPRESWFTKCLPGLSLVVTTSLAIALLLGQRYRRAFSGSFYDYVVGNPSSTAIIVQFISHILGTLLVYTLTTLLNFRTRLHLTSRPISMWCLSWWTSLCTQRLDRNLPWAYGCPLFLWWCKFTFPLPDHNLQPDSA